MWLGWKDHKAEDWPQLRRDVAEAYSRHTACYLAGTPMLGDFLEGGLETLNYPVSKLESTTL
jgi:uncharacterized protein DUF3775